MRRGHLTTILALLAAAGVALARTLSGATVEPEPAGDLPRELPVRVEPVPAAPIPELSERPPVRVVLPPDPEPLGPRECLGCGRG